jgi:hypothetical protein
MNDEEPRRSKARSVTVTALLGLFVIAVLAALTGRLVPGGLSGMFRRVRGQGGKDPEDR